MSLIKTLFVLDLQTISVVTYLDRVLLKSYTLFVQVLSWVLVLTREHEFKI